ncbi:MAG: polyisoprenyl-phosphate glycosyltransferase [Acetobacteraceae bacterium]|jgi:glycosyltransferase involved in cell wall biosynthesis|nr:polyisoprenyl-phosphate glycosyltransferase [Acetobacteraceae bacterium]
MQEVFPKSVRRSWQPAISVVVPAYNEVDGLDIFHRRLLLSLSAVDRWEVVYVNDGSTDATLAVMEALHRTDDRVGVVSLSRNFGKEIALTAGLDHATGDAVVVIDADLQDPPELIPELIAHWQAGFDMVYAKRRSRAGDSWVKRGTAWAFYRLMQRMGDLRLPEDTGDFRLMSRRVVDAVRQLREQHRFMKGLFAWVGYPTTFVLYDREARHRGATKWSYWRLWNLAWEGITSFTVMPLRLATYVGLGVAMLAVIYAAVVIVKTLIIGNRVAGYPSLMAVVLFLGGVQLMFLGVIGEYLGRVFNETKRRPLYLVERYVPSAIKVSI